MRNTLPLYLDLFIATFAVFVTVSRVAVIKRGQGRHFTVVIAFFVAADVVKVGPINDVLAELVDGRLVRVAAQVLTVAAAVGAVAAVRHATRMMRSRMAALTPWIGLGVVAAALVVLDASAGSRNLPIEAAAPVLSVAYFAIYSASIVFCDGYALVVVGRAYARGMRRGGVTSAGIVALGLFLATGLNSISLLWYAIASSDGHIGTAERVQRDSNGNVYAIFTLVISVLGLLGTFRYARRKTAVSKEWEKSVAGLPPLWEFLTSVAPEVRLMSTAGLSREARLIRMIAECIDASVVLGRDIRDVVPGSTSWRPTHHTPTPEQVLGVARSWCAVS
ncbi:hypothetical protein SAMN05445060_4097 [Williamsia sterculiae]|uniref:Integral membrane protein n=1 Tax=Williamsia sterculiae TaxID=1344003 RepID=A0A1N7HER2_9NOCA|nr:hypothetical protein SAMN05445060_4097 [Williamsia sterculiae]